MRSPRKRGGATGRRERGDDAADARRQDLQIEGGQAQQDAVGDRAGGDQQAIVAGAVQLGQRACGLRRFAGPRADQQQRGDGGLRAEARGCIAAQAQGVAQHQAPVELEVEPGIVGGQLPALFAGRPSGADRVEPCERGARRQAQAGALAVAAAGEGRQRFGQDGEQAAAGDLGVQVLLGLGPGRTEHLGRRLRAEAQGSAGADLQFECDPVASDQAAAVGRGAGPHRHSARAREQELQL